VGIAVCGFYVPGIAGDHIFEVGIFATAGAITNWLAIHMLFEPVPGLYGSGVIPKHFEDFKAGIRSLIMEQFFTEDNIQKFLNSPEQKLEIDGQSLLSNIDLDDVFNGFLDVIKASQFGGMLNMIGGVSALETLRDPFNKKIREVLLLTVKSESFQSKLSEAVNGQLDTGSFYRRIEAIVQQRLDELTPQIIKTIIQDIIKKHLGWLVVWGGVFGGLIGLLTSLCRQL